MGRIEDLTVRALVVLVAAFALWKSALFARADLAWSDGTTAGLRRAAEILPRDADIASRLALRRVDDGEESPDVDAALLKATELNPLNSEILMTRGLRAELRGNIPEAEKLLVQAAGVDHQFKPSWTLANFAVRADRMDHFWPMIKRCLEIEPFGFDPDSIFDLVWKVSDDAKQIQSLFPPRSAKTLRYLAFLVGSNRTDASVALWPIALEALDSSIGSDLAVAHNFPAFLIEKGRTPVAVRAWNQLVDRNFVHSGKLDPSSGALLADPQFSFERNTGIFSWQVAQTDNIFPAPDFSALRFELDGNQAQSVVLASTSTLVVPGRNHKLSWQADGTRLNLATDLGFYLRIIRPDGKPVAECPPLLENHGAGSCTFAAGKEDEMFRLELGYSRAQGTSRATGTIEISAVKVEAVS